MKNRSVIFGIVLTVLGCFTLLSRAQAVSPPPDGCYPNFTTAEGCEALNSLTTGAGNTGTGWRSLFFNTDGSFNTAVGGGALVLSNADSNTAVGAAALLLNTTGSNNTAIGTDTLVFNDSGVGNTATGYFALMNNTTGNSNTAVGRVALTNHQTGSFNTAIGNQALEVDTSGARNTAVGSVALGSNTTGNDNTAVGRHAGDAITGNGNVCIGEGVGGQAGVANRTYIRNVNTDAVSGGGTDFVTVDLTTGRMGHLTSSRRYKEGIKPMDNSSEALYRLKPVTFRYKKEVNSAQNLEYGLIAEEVNEVDPNLAIRNGKGQIESVRYMAVNAMLLNEFLKEHRKVEQLKSDFQATVAEQRKEIQALTAQLKEQTAQIQKVSAQVEASKPAPQVVNNP